MKSLKLSERFLVVWIRRNEKINIKKKEWDQHKTISSGEQTGQDWSSLPHLFAHDTQTQQKKQ